tara:strand:- start:7522 stop:7641 length:120 start_codon:yes stop_codon:yes gene_type:complete
MERVLVAGPIVQIILDLVKLIGWNINDKLSLCKAKKNRD